VLGGAWFGVGFHLCVDGRTRLVVRRGYLWLPDPFCLRETKTFFRFFEEPVPVTVAIPSLSLCSASAYVCLPWMRLRRNRDSVV
jgi:hypothetical protein